MLLFIACLNEAVYLLFPVQGIEIMKKKINLLLFTIDCFGLGFSVYFSFLIKMRIVMGRTKCDGM